MNDFPPYPKPREMYYEIPAFIDGHKGACEIVCRISDGMPLAAVYYFPPGIQAAETKAFFRRLQAECEWPRQEDDCD